MSFPWVPWYSTKCSSLSSFSRNRLALIQFPQILKVLIILGPVAFYYQYPSKITSWSIFFPLFVSDYVVVQPIMRIKYVCLTRRAFVLFNCRSNNQKKNKNNAPQGKNFPQIMLEEFWAALIPWHQEHTKVSTDDIYV